LITPETNIHVTACLCPRDEVLLTTDLPNGNNTNTALVADHPDELPMKMATLLKFAV